MPRLLEGMETLILYDGVCGLCNKVTQFVLPRDRRNRFRFAALQSDLAKRVLERHGRSAALLDTFYVVEALDTPAEVLHDRSDAALRVFGGLGGVYALATIFRVLPRFLRNIAYNFVARHRYGWFGRTDSCQVPRPEWRHKFIG